jgi:hypothetical protein
MLGGRGSVLERPPQSRYRWNYLVAFAFLGMAAFFAFAFKVPTAPA